MQDTCRDDLHACIISEVSTYPAIIQALILDLCKSVVVISARDYRINNVSTRDWRGSPHTCIDGVQDDLQTNVVLEEPVTETEVLAIREIHKDLFDLIWPETKFLEQERSFQAVYVQAPIFIQVLGYETSCEWLGLRGFDNPHQFLHRGRVEGLDLDTLPIVVLKLLNLNGTVSSKEVWNFASLILSQIRNLS